MPKQKAQTEKEVIAHIEANTPLRNKKHFALTSANHWGDRRKFAFMFFYRELEAVFGVKDEAPAGYSYQYPIDMGSTLEDMLTKAGLRVVDVHIGSHVHGYIHRVVYIAGRD